MYIIMLSFQNVYIYKIYWIYILIISKNINEISATGLADFVYQISVYHNKNIWNGGKPMVEIFRSLYILRGYYHHRKRDNMFILILDIILLLISFQGRVQSSKPLDQLHIMQFAVCHYIYFLCVRHVLPTDDILELFSFWNYHHYE